MTSAEGRDSYKFANGGEIRRDAMGCSVAYIYTYIPLPSSKACV